MKLKYVDMSRVEFNVMLIEIEIELCKECSCQVRREYLDEEGMLRGVKAILNAVTPPYDVKSTKQTKKE